MKKWLFIGMFLLSQVGFLSAQELFSKRSDEIIGIEGVDYYLHVVKQGETLSSLSRLYNVPVQRIEDDNPLVKEQGLKYGHMIKIYCAKLPDTHAATPRKTARTFNEHIVAQGETAYSIARRYMISINILIKDNPGLDPSNLSIGQKLYIRKSEVGETPPQVILSEIDMYANTMSVVSGEFIYHVVDIGETIYSLSRKYGVEREDITANNNLADGLKAGNIIKIPAGRIGKIIDGEQETGTYPDHFTDQTPSKFDTIWIDSPYFDRDTIESTYKHTYVYDGVLNVAMMLPLSGARNTSGRNNYIEFYQGALLALEDIKRSGYSVNMNVYDVGRSAESVYAILRLPELSEMNLIIGPVYEEPLAPVVRFAGEYNIPVVSPLAAVSGSYGELLYQMSPDPAGKYDKMEGMFSGDENIIFVTSDNNDLEFEREMIHLMGGIPYQRIVYNKGTPAEYFNSLLLDPNSENVFVVLAGDETGVDLILAALSSVQNNRLARSLRTGSIKVVGSSKWTRYRNIDKNLLFKLNTSFVTTYHSDRTNENIRYFVNRYISGFDEVPSLYSFRGYDAVKLFTKAMITTEQGGRLDETLLHLAAPLQTGYKFERDSKGNYSNTNWSLVTYNNDYTITVE